MNRKMNQKLNKEFRRADQTIRPETGRRERGESSWADFFTHDAVPTFFAMQESFKQEQR